MRSIAAGLAVCLVVAGSLWMRARPSGPPERIVLVVVDMLRRDRLGCYGAPRATPHIDGLAARGQRFENAVSSFYGTTMSMGALFTGRTPSIETGDPAKTLSWNGGSWCGMGRFAVRDEELCIPWSLPTLAEELRTRGYWTMGVTSNLMLYEPGGFARGFDDWVEAGARRDEDPRLYARRPRVSRGAYGGVLASSVNAAVRDLLDRRRDERFFLYVHYMDVHDHAALGASYEQGVALADSGVGELLALLEGERLLGEAVVILTSDHGERLGEKHPVKGFPRHYGNPSFDYLLRVPLIVSPAVFEDTSRLVRGQDLHELILELAGSERRAAVDLEEGELFVSEWSWQTYRRDGWKAAFSRRGDRVLLFDLEDDPGERRDVSALHPERVRTMRQRVSELTRALADDEPGRSGLEEEERARLQALGYLPPP